MAAPGLETFVMATNGQSNWSTFRQPDPVFNNFFLGPSIPSNAISNPAVLASDGIAGTYRVSTGAPATVLSDSLSTAGAGTSVFGNWTYSGNTAVTVQQGQLKSESHAVHTGNADNHTINTAESYGIVRETFTPTSPGAANGTAGTMRLAYTFNGALSVVGKGTAGMAFRYGYGPTATLNNTLLETFAEVYGNGLNLYGPHSYLGSFMTPPGMTLTIGPTLPDGAPSFVTFNGTTTLIATVPVVWGASTDYMAGLMTFTNIGNGSGTMDSDFFQSATLTGIQMFNSAGQQVNNFSITSGSGTFYDANGARLAATAADAPEPTALALLAPALLLGGLAARKTRKA
jgi:hypothetical protein